jgi:hypothetical protein
VGGFPPSPSYFWVVMGGAPPFGVAVVAVVGGFRRATWSKWVVTLFFMWVDRARGRGNLPTPRLAIPPQTPRLAFPPKMLFELLDRGLGLSLIGPVEFRPVQQQT